MSLFFAMCGVFRYVPNERRRIWTSLSLWAVYISKGAAVESVSLQLARLGERISLGDQLRVTQGIQNVGTRANFPNNKFSSFLKEIPSVNYCYLLQLGSKLNAGLKF